MKIITRAPVEKASGKQGNQLVFMQWRNTQVAREYAVPSNPQSASQQVVRAYLASITARWATLSSATREGWATYAANNPVTNSLGVEVRSTALGMYVRLNSISLMRTDGVTYVDTAPTAARPAPITGVTGGSQADPNQLILIPTHGISSVAGLYVMGKVEILASAAVTPDVRREIMVSGPDSGSFEALVASGQNITFEGTRYTFSSGDEVGVTLYVVDTSGQVSAPFTTSIAWEV